MTVIKIEEGDKLIADEGISEWIVKRDYDFNPVLELLPFDEKAHQKRLKNGDYEN
ncbi:MAG: hypothetical protein KJI69_04605 [Patescibacteria group bacterium]|nr:hypothetical protein [Patescibacteria group bacterium]